MIGKGYSKIGKKEGEFEIKKEDSQFYDEQEGLIIYAAKLTPSPKTLNTIPTVYEVFKSGSSPHLVIADESSSEHSQRLFYRNSKGQIREIGEVDREDIILYPRITEEFIRGKLKEIKEFVERIVQDDQKSTEKVYDTPRVKDIPSEYREIFQPQLE